MYAWRLAVQTLKQHLQGQAQSPQLPEHNKYITGAFFLVAGPPNYFSRDDTGQHVALSLARTPGWNQVPLL